jgi:hypothetical protein
MFEIENAAFVDSDIHYDVPGYPLGSFRISIGGMAKRIGFDWTIPVGEMRPIGARGSGHEAIRRKLCSSKILSLEIL